MTPCAADLAGVTVQVAVAGVVLALVVTGLYAVLVLYVQRREHNARRKAWRERETGQ